MRTVSVLGRSAGELRSAGFEVDHHRAASPERLGDLDAGGGRAAEVLDLLDRGAL